jgi:hypothetical protein
MSSISCAFALETKPAHIQAATGKRELNFVFRMMKFKDGCLYKKVENQDRGDKHQSQLL